jgi:hypothetical protein
MVQLMANAGYFDDPQLWTKSACGDDVMLGMYTRAVGLRSMSLVARGEPFGISYLGLADTPANLSANGHSLIHSVKNDRVFREDTIRAFFAQRRTAMPCSVTTLRPRQSDTAERRAPDTARSTRHAMPRA